MIRMFRYFLPILIAVAAVWPLSAAATETGDGAPASPEKVAREAVQTLLDEMEGRREELRNNPEKLDALIERVLVPLVDVDHMSRLVLGRHWRNASEEQRERFQAAFKNMLISTYGNALLEFRRDKIEFQPLRAEEGAEDVTFRAVVRTETGEEIPVEFDLHLVDGEWRAYNGSVGNLTFVTNYRGQFNQEIRRSDLETLIGKLESRYGPDSG